MRNLALVFAMVAALQAAPVRVLIFSGYNNHDWRTTTPFLAKLLKDTGRFDVRVQEAPAGTTAETLANFDVLVVDYQGPRWGETTEKAVLDFVRSGKGLVLVHGTLYAFSGFDILSDGHKQVGRTEPVWKEYAELAGGTWAGAPPKNYHAPRHLFDVKITAPEHPVVNDLGGHFAVADELYHGLRMLPTAQILATAYDDPKNGGTGKDEPMLWANPYGKGRVFSTVLGHEVPAMREPGFAATFARGVEWAASGEVTLPAKLPEARVQQPIRVQLVTGGHDHDPDFYRVVLDRPELAVTVNPHPGAYTHDMRKDVDVLVLYDFVQTSAVSEERRKNLREFLESGKGMVVLHHAIADFNDWRWWWEEVVGGKYLMKPEDGRPGSTYKHDEDVYAVPVGEHYITQGIGPIHMRDETYKGMWISPDSKVLMKTDNPTSDGPVVWIGPYKKAHVVYIELGHDRFANNNPAYRELVYRAIDWAMSRRDRKLRQPLETPWGPKESSEPEKK